MDLGNGHQQWSGSAANHNGHSSTPSTRSDNAEGMIEEIRKQTTTERPYSEVIELNIDGHAHLTRTTICITALTELRFQTDFFDQESFDRRVFTVFTNNVTKDCISRLLALERPARQTRETVKRVGGNRNRASLDRRINGNEERLAPTSQQIIRDASPDDIVLKFVGQVLTYALKSLHSRLQKSPNPDLIRERLQHRMAGVGTQSLPIAPAEHAAPLNVRT